MCCFSKAVEHVSNTNIFARSSAEGRQFLSYEMHLSSKEDLAMILPLPVPPKSAEDAVRFISLKDYPDFFKDLKKGFPEPEAKSLGVAKGNAPSAQRALAVIEVGEFEASFVPGVGDFARLDARFRLPDGTWESLPTYKEYGFAVFKLKKGAKTIHPMAFEYPRKDARRLFFPTVHIHDGKVHEKADFDHSIYCQKKADEAFDLMTWGESPQLASTFMKAGKDGGLVDLEKHVFLKSIRGEQKNADVFL